MSKPIGKLLDMDTLTIVVIRQALTEYVDARAPGILDRDDVNEALAMMYLEVYVDNRYEGHDVELKVQRMNLLVPRILAAIEAIQRLRG